MPALDIGFKSDEQTNKQKAKEISPPAALTAVFVDLSQYDIFARNHVKSFSV
jgi:hypothetical protein